jgi:hypothetical protein
VKFAETHRATLRYDERAVTLSVDERPIARFESGIARLVTDKLGRPQSLIGISEHVETISISRDLRPSRQLILRPDEVLAFSWI